MKINIRKTNAFTLVEMLAVIVLLGLLMVITFPKILEMIGAEEDKITIAQTNMIKAAVKSYLFDNSNYYLAREGNTYCISLNDLETEGYLAIDADDLDLNKSAYIKYTSDEQYDITIVSECE